MSKLYPIVVVTLLALVTGHYLFGPKEIYLKHNCDIQKEGSCTIKQDDLSFTFSLNPNPIIPTEDVSYTLVAKGLDIEKVTLRILGHDMEMPRDEQVFPLDSFLNKEEYKATRTFPTCTEKLMTWRLYFVIKAKNIWVRTSFDLEVKRPS
jgi:hypothetical protein